MTFLNSIGLFALAALSIPLVIHLWNIRPGKTLKVGSIMLIGAWAQKSRRSFKLNDVLLFLLRCLLLTLLAIVLAVPIWKNNESAAVKGWLLLPKENLKESCRKFKPEIDSLTNAGYEFHYFNTGFAKTELIKALADTTGIKSVTNAPYWTLVHHLDALVTTALPVYLFTPNNSAHFTGSKPEVSINLHWQTYTAADSTSSWLESAWLNNNNDIEVLQGNSKPSGTAYTTYSVQPGERRNLPLTLDIDSGRMTVRLKNSNTINVDTITWHFAVYGEKNEPDAGYVVAALKSIVQFTKHKAVIKQYSDKDKIQPHQSWLFWLSQKVADKQSIAKCDNFFTYTPGTTSEHDTWIDYNSQSLSSKKIPLYKSIIANYKGHTLWQDGFGDPLLVLQKRQEQNMYHFYSRFDPSWNDLVWSDAFPKMLLKLIVNDSLDLSSQYDRRAIDTEQLMPIISNDGYKLITKANEQTGLVHYFWLLVILLFLIERWLSHRKHSTITGRVLQNG